MLLIENNSVKAGHFFVERLSKYKDFYYLVVFLPKGHRCGYVLVDNNHKYYGLDYEELSDIKVHGKLTYSNTLLTLLGYDVLKELQAIDNKDSWALGFDCNHTSDIKDLATWDRYYTDEMYACYRPQSRNVNSFRFLSDDDDCFYAQPTIKDLDFCINECKKVIDTIQNN